ITRALAEMTRFAVHTAANPMTCRAPAGVRDLIVTSTSSTSRNYPAGYALGQGHSLEASAARLGPVAGGQNRPRVVRQQSQEEGWARLGQVAEGVNTLRVLRQKSEEEGVYMPLVAGLHAIIFEQQPLQEVIGRLMSAEQKHDVEFSAFMPRRATDKEQQ